MGRPRKWVSDAERKAAARATPEIVNLPQVDDAKRVDSEPEVAALGIVNRAEEIDASPRPDPSNFEVAELVPEIVAEHADPVVVDGRYRGFQVVDVDVQHDAHRYLFERAEVRSFYVSSPRGALGLVPFPGSTVVWPWEAAGRKTSPASIAIATTIVVPPISTGSSATRRGAHDGQVELTRVGAQDVDLAVVGMDDP